MIRVSARLGALAVALPLVLGLAACGGSGGGGSSSDSAKSLRVLDYYSNEPDKTVYTKVLDACGKANGVSIKREAVPGDTLIQKVLQQSSSKTLPDVLMLDNPDLQQIAATGALAPLDEFGLSADGYAKGVVDASTYKGKLYGLQPITNTIALFYNKDILAKAGVDPPQTWDELKRSGEEADQGQAVRDRRSTPPPTTRAPGSSCPSCGPTAVTRRTSPPRRPPRRSSCWSTWSRTARRRSRC